MTASHARRSHARDWSSVALALLVASVCVVVVSTLFIERFGAIDELGLYNPVYVWLTTGKMAYPAHYYFDAMVVHPPVHYLAIGLWMKLGLGIYYAEAMPTLLMHLVALAAIARSPFSVSIRAALTVGLVAPILVLRNTQVEWFGMRPEGELNAAWIAGLVLLESARQRDWNHWQLLLGSALLTYASTLHYYAAFAWLGAAIYATWAVMTAPSHRRGILLSIVVGGLAVGVPFTIGFVVPHFAAIRGMVASVQQAGSGSTTPFDDHLAQYQWFKSVYPTLGARWALVATGLGPVIVTGVPAFFWVFGWARWRSMRGFLIASMPLLLALLLFAQRKHTLYYVHELTLASAAICGFVFAGLASISERVHRVRLLAPFALSVLALTLPFLPPRAEEIAIGGHVHEMEVARAAALTIVGPDAALAGRIGTWFISGARRWFGIDNYMYANTGVDDPSSFLARFDAFPEASHMSNIVGPNGEGLTAWFAARKLWLRGFYISRPANREISHVLLVSQRADAVRGYINAGGKVLRFDEQSGNTAVVAARCSSDATRAMVTQGPSIALTLPARPNTSPDSMVTAVMKAGDALPPGCVEFERRAGTLTSMSEGELLEHARRVDGPMQFYQVLSAVPARNGQSFRNTAQ